MENPIEKLTITRLGEPQNKQGTSKAGKPYNFNVIGFQAEGKQGWFNFNYNGNLDQHTLEADKEYEFVLTSREYMGKDGTKKTAWNAAFPKPVDAQGADIEKIKNELVGIKLDIHSIKAQLAAKKSNYPEMESEPNFDLPTNEGHDYPTEDLPF